MKSGKNILYYLIISSGLSLASCKQENNSPTVFGRWAFISLSYDTTSTRYKEMSPEERTAQLTDMNNTGSGVLFDFRKDSTYSVTSAPEKKLKVVYGTYKSTGKNELLLTPDNGAPQVGKIILLDKTTLQLNDPVQGLILTLKRI